MPAMLRGLKFHQRGRLAEAERLYQSVLDRQPDHFDALHLLGVLRAQQGNHEAAVELISLALERQPRSAEVYSNLGNVLQTLDRHDKAIANFDQALALKPDYFDALYNRGAALVKLNRHAEAIENYDRILAIRPDHADTLNNRGAALAKLGRLKDAITNFGKALAINPHHADALNNCGTALAKLHLHDEAIASFDKALAERPDFADAHYNRGGALAGLRRHDEAIASYNEALALRPEHIEAHYNRGKSLQELSRHEEAVASYDKALAGKPDYADALNNRGGALAKLNRYDEAIASFDKALAIRPDYTEVLYNRGIALQALNRHVEAIASYDKALTIDTHHADAFNNRGNALHAVNRDEEAIASYDSALAILPDYKYALGASAYCRARICDWEMRSLMEQRLLKGLRSGHLVSTPFALLSVSHDPADQRTCATAFARHRYPVTGPPLTRGVKYRHDRIRVAYLSADFRNHAVAHLIAGLLEWHDRARFQVFGISFGPDMRDEMQARLKGAIECFIDVRQKSDSEIAVLLRDLEIDIAVDLMGFTQRARPRILASRPAPVQVNYLGYPATMGADYMDYIVADDFVIPEDRQIHYSERVVYLPDCYQANDSKRTIAERTPTRAEAKLPDEGFVYCCFNNSYKLSPPIFDIWMRLLQRVEHSVLWLVQGTARTVDNLRREAHARSIHPDRLIFAERVKLDDYLARYRIADLFLDTLPFNAGTTASDALWAGLPVVTCAGNAFAARMAGSLLRAVGLPELVTDTLEQYEALAGKLASHPPLLQQIKEKLARNRLTYPLFDTDRFGRHLEAAYITMWERHQRGQPPAVFSVPRAS